MSRIHCTTLSQVAGVKVVPTDMERFSRQLVPERASCSFSVIGQALMYMYMYMYIHDRLLERQTTQHNSPKVVIFKEK